MSISLLDRLDTSDLLLQEAEQFVNEADPPMHLDVQTRFLKLLTLRESIQSWKEQLTVRNNAFDLLDGLEHRADQGDTIKIFDLALKFQNVRAMFLYSYLTSSWALADSICNASSAILRPPHFHASGSTTLIQAFISSEAGKKQLSGALFPMVRRHFGWRVGLYYAIRNHFAHDTESLTFFDGPTAASGFRISSSAWDKMEAVAKGYEVQTTDQVDAATWPASPQDDLRLILALCDQALDNTLGILWMTASRLLHCHISTMCGRE